MNSRSFPLIICFFLTVCRGRGWVGDPAPASSCDDDGIERSAVVFGRDPFVVIPLCL
jgi:hypothetical protein